MLFSTAGMSRWRRTGRRCGDDQLGEARARAPRRPCPSSSAASRCAGLMSSPPLSKHTPLPMIAMRGSRSRPQSSSISRGRALARRAAPDRGDHRKALVERVAVRDLDLGAAVVAERADRGFELGRAEVGGGGVDEVADERGRAAPRATMRSMRRGVGGEQDARAGAGVGLGAIAVEAVLGEQPAERGDARGRLRRGDRCPRGALRRAGRGTTG